MPDPESPQQQEASVLHLAIRGFATLYQELAPEALVGMLNAYLDAVAAAIEQHQGCVDHYGADAVTAHFGDPQRALDTALAVAGALPALNRHFAQKGWPPLAIGAGIHTDMAVAGYVGPTARRRYTVLGPAVDVAARLERLCAGYGAPIIVSDAVVQRCHGAVFRELDLARPPEAREALAIFAAVGRDADVGDAQRAQLAAYARALATYRAGRFAEALLEFAAGPQDTVSQLYRMRCARNMIEPPGAAWDRAVPLLET